MLIRYSITSVICLLAIFFLFAGLAIAQDSLPKRLKNDEAEDAELDCLECTRGDLLTVDLLTGEVTRRTPSEAAPDLLRLLTEGGAGALVTPGGGITKDFSSISPVGDSTTGDYPKHVKIHTKYLNEHGAIVYSQCSGTMIDPFHVLTAGHCVYKFEDENGNDVDAWAYEVEILPGLNNNIMYFGRAYSVELHSWAGWSESEDWDWDVALIDLEWPIGATTGWRGYGSNPDCDWYTGGFWTHIGYPGEDIYDGTVMYEQTGTFDGCESVGHEVWFEREMFKGQSGGGAVRDGGVYAVRSNSTWVGIDDWDTYDCRITNDMFYDITAWIAADTPSQYDLISLTVTAPADMTLGQFYGFDFLVHNYSSVSASGTFPINVYLSTDDIIDGSDTLVGSVNAGLSVNAKGNEWQHVGIIPTCSAVPGSYFLGVHVVDNDANPGNNWTQTRHVVPVNVHAVSAPPTPSNLSPTEWSLCEETDTINLAWTNSGATCEYEVQFGTSPNEGPIYSATNNYYTVTNLAHDTLYYWSVRARLPCGTWSDWGNWTGFRTVADIYDVASVVAPLDEAHCEDSSVLLEWTSLPQADTYDIQVSPNWCYEGPITTGISGTQHTLSGLDPNTTYYWRVRAQTECGQTTNWSSVPDFCWTFKTGPTAIAPPVRIGPGDETTCGNASTSLTWQHAEDWDHYDVQVGTSCDTGTVYQTSSNGFQPPALQSGVVYYWRVRTHHECGLVSDWTDCWSFSLDLEPPTNPASLASSSHTIETWSNDNVIHTHWDWGLDNCDGSWPQYATLWDRSPDTEPTEPTTSGEATLEASPPLGDGIDHWFHVRTVDWAGNLAVETMHLGPFWIDTTVPSAVPGLTTCEPEDLYGDFDTFSAFWGAATDAASGLAGYSYVLDENPLPGVEPDGTIDTSLQRVTLPGGSWFWYYRIRAIDVAGNMGPVAEVGPFFTEETLPAFHGPVCGEELLEHTTYRVNWETVRNATGGRLLLSLDGGFGFRSLTNLTAFELEGGYYNWSVPAESSTQALLQLEWDTVFGTFTSASRYFTLVAVSGIPDERPAGAEVVLEGNYPNPFNPQTTIAFTLPEPGAASLRIFDLSGRIVRVLAVGELYPAGRHEEIWNGRDSTGRRVSSGTYFYRLEAGAFSETKRMVLLK